LTKNDEAQVDSEQNNCKKLEFHICNLQRISEKKHLTIMFKFDIMFECQIIQ